MKWLSRLLAGLLAVALMVTAVAWVSNGTIWNSDYVVKTASDQKIYDRIAKALTPVLISQQSTGDQRFLLGQLITPSLVRQHLEGPIFNLLQYYRYGGTPPSLNFNDIKQQFDALRLAPPPLVAALLAKPVTLSNPGIDRLAMGASRQASQQRWLAPLAAGLIAFIIVIISGRRRWNVLAGAAVGATVLTAIVAGLSLLLPSITTMGLSTTVWSALTPIFKGLGEAMARDVSQQLLWWSVGFAVLAVLMGLGGLAAGASRKFRRRPEKTVIAD